MWQGGSDDYFDGLLDLRKTHARRVDAVSGAKANEVVGRADAREGSGSDMGQRDDETGSVEIPDWAQRERDAMTKAPDLVNHPPHYTSDPSGVECITITRHRNFNIGNAIKYLWRAGLKGSEVVVNGSVMGHTGPGAARTIEDLKKARWYIADEIRRLGGDPDK